MKRQADRPKLRQLPRVSERKGKTTAAVLIIVGAAVVVMLATMWRMRGDDRVVQYSPPPGVREPDRVAKTDQAIAQITSEATLKARAAAPTALDDASARQFEETLLAALRAYNFGTPEAFAQSRRVQGFAVPEEWASTYARKQTLAAQAGLLEEAPAQGQIQVARRLERGRTLDEPALPPAMHRTAGTVGIARGDGDILDPVAANADAFEVSFPQRIRDYNGQTADGTVRIWLVNRPSDKRWLVYRIILEYRDQDLPGAVVLPPL